MDIVQGRFWRRELSEEEKKFDVKMREVWFKWVITVRL